MSIWVSKEALGPQECSKPYKQEAEMNIAV